MKIKITEVDNNTTIKLKDDEGETVCYIHYNKSMNVVEIKNANKKPIKYIPLGE
jgi:nicotinic acid phosphoribosyltransferase